MEEENQVLGRDAQKPENYDSEENLNFYHTDRELLEKNIDSSIENLTKLFESASQDEPDISEDEVNKAIDKILEITHPAEKQSDSEKTDRARKVTIKVLFIAAILSILSVSCLFAVGNSRDISIENGFITFAKDTVKIVFFGEDKEGYITVDALLADLKQHGYEDILFPQEFVYNADEYKCTAPEYVNQYTKQVNFTIINETVSYVFSIYDYEGRKEADYITVDDMKSIVVDDTYIYISECNNETTIDFIYNGQCFFITANIPYSDMVKIVESIK